MPGVQAVSAGVGVTIDASGILSLDGSDPGFNGFIKTNNGSAFNAYVWPGVDGTSGQFLQTDGAGNLAWADASGFAVVTVKSGAPTPADIGELWFDCATGTLNVYQNCVGTPSPNWFNVAQPGFPVLPGNTSASPAFATGTGTQIDPYDCSVTSVGAGTTVQILNTVTVTTLVPFQFVPIVDLNAVINGGRFSFTNNYADASGNLTFDIVFTDLPTSPTGTPFTALIKIGYGSAYVESRVNIVAPLAVSGGTVTGPAYSNQQLTYVPGVASGGSTPYGPLTYQWYADGVAIGGATGLTYTVTAGNVGKVITATTSVTDASGQTATGTSNLIGPIVADPGTLTVLPGSIAPTTAVVGNTLNYTTGSYSLGIPPITATWVWQRAGVDIAGTANLTSYLLVAADAGQAITVRYTATDSSTPTADTAFASTNAVTPTAPFPGGVWGPTPSGGMGTNPGGVSGIYSGTGTTITVTGCLESAVYTPPALPSFDATSKSITAGQTLAIRWAATALCGNANTNTLMNGTVSDGIYTNSYSLNINRVPTAIGDITDTNVALGATVSKGIATAISGLNSVAYVTAGSGSTGTSIGVSLTPGGPFTPIPATGSTSFPISNTQTLYVEQTVGGAINTAPGYTAVVKVGDADGVLADEFTYFAQTVNTAVFPGLTFSPAGGPNAANESVVNVIDGTLGTLNGVANSNGWPTGLGTTLSSPLSGGVATMKFQKNGAGGFVTSGLGVVPTDILNLAWNVAYLDTVTTGSTATGSITGTVGATPYTNTFTMTVERAASFTTTSGASSGASGTITLVSQVPDQYNVPVKVYQAAPGSNALTSVTVDINSNGPVALPTTAGTALTLNPGETVVFSATAPAGAATYTTDIHIGDTVHTWSYQVTVTPTVSTPQINNPSSTPAVNPALNSPAGITVTTPTAGNAGGFQTNYSGTQVNSIWDVYKGGYPLTSTNKITNVTQNGAGSISSSVLMPGTGTYSGSVIPFKIGSTIVNGQLYSTDGGVNWNTSTTAPAVLSSGNYAQIGNTLYGAVAGSTSILKTTDGNNWTTLSTLPANARSVGSGGGGCVVTDGTNLLVPATPSGVFRSTDGGLNWTLVNLPGNPTVDYLTYVNGRFLSFYGGATRYFDQSVDGGANWTMVSTDLPSSFYVWGSAGYLAYSNGTYIIAGALSAPNSARVFRSTNLTAWTNCSPTAPIAFQMFFGASEAGGALYVGCYADGAGKTLYGSTDGAVTWAPVSTPWDGLGASSFGSKLLGTQMVTTAAVSILGNWYVGTGTTASTTLTIANCQTEGFLAGDTVISGSGAAAGPATILSLTNAQVVVTSSTGWVGTNTQTLKRDPASYTAVTGFPLTKTTAPLNEAFIAQANLSTSSKYYASVTFTGSGTPNVVSSPSAWSEFNTTASFAIPPGTPMGGGYFGGQIKIGSTIYNLIVAPAEGNSTGPATGGALKGQYGGSAPTTIQYSTSTAAASNPSQAQDLEYGGTWTNTAGGLTTAGLGGIYPLFGWCKWDTAGPNGGGGIGGFTDWYIPAKNELEVLYYYLKPDSTGTQPNNTSYGSNPNAVAPEPVSTNYTSTNPAQTTADGLNGTGNFQSGGAQAFTTINLYWASSENSGNTTGAEGQWFRNGLQSNGSKNANQYARAIRRILA